MLETDLKRFVRGLRGEMTEEVRTAVANAIVDALVHGDNSDQGWYENYGRDEFLRQCEIGYRLEEVNNEGVNDTVDVDFSKLPTCEVVCFEVPDLLEEE